MLGTTLNFKRINNLNISNSDLQLLFVSLSYIVGCIVSLSFVISDNVIILRFGEELFDSIITFKADNNYLIQFCFTMLPLFVFLVLGYFFGAAIFGPALVPSLIFAKGLYDGLIVCYCYRTYSLNGIAFVLLTLLPTFLASTYILILAYRESIGFSMNNFKNAMPRGTSYNLSAQLKMFSVRYLILFIFGIIAILICTLFSVIFFEYFGF